jgi:hypothetical protein
MRTRTSGVGGLTYRVGRHLPGAAEPFRELLTSMSQYILGAYFATSFAPLLMFAPTAAPNNVASAAGDGMVAMLLLFYRVCFTEFSRGCQQAVHLHPGAGASRSGQNHLAKGHGALFVQRPWAGSCGGGQQHGAGRWV